MNLPNRTDAGDVRRDQLPNQPDGSESSGFTHLQGVRHRLPPGPGRHYDRRHFQIQERVGTILMLLMLAIVVFWVAVDLRLAPDVFGWFAAPRD